MFGKLVLVLGLICAALPAQAAETLVVYSGRSDKFVRPVIDVFTAQTGIKVVLHSAKSTGLLNKLNVEGQRTDADLFISNDAGSLQTGADLGLFQPVSDEVAAQVPEAYRAPDNNWIGLSARARVLVVNSNRPDLGFLKSVFDLADPRLKGVLAITDSTNESFIAGTTVYMRAAGEDRTRAWLTGMQANVGGRVFSKHGRIVKAVASGQKAVGLVNHYYIYRHLENDPRAPIRILVPDQGPDGMGVAWNVAGIAVTKHTRQRALAEQLVAFLISEQGQQMFARVNREYPVRPGVAAAPEVPPAGSYRVADVPMFELGRYRNETIDLLDRVGMP